jgi:hypothetical protein
MMVLPDALATSVAIAEFLLASGVALLRGLAEPLDRFTLILGDASARVITNT